MTLTKKIEDKLRRLKSESEKIEDFVDFEIFTLDEFEAGQVGYSIDSYGNSLVSNEEGAWKSRWVVIGCETLCGDPIIIDTKENAFPVIILRHGSGQWDEGAYLSESIEKFINEIKKINKFITKKAHENVTPKITCESLDNLINEIIKEDMYGDIDEWEKLLGEIYNSTQEYEDSLAKKIKAMNERGMKIEDISSKLNMSIKNTYRYLKL